jgi:hypothetical protein
MVWAVAFEVLPAAIFGGAVGLSSAAALAAPFASMTPVSAGAAAFGCAWLILRRIGSPRRLYVHEFDLSAFEPQEADQEPELDELVLDEPIVELDELILDELALERSPAAQEESRVIRLFNPAEMQTAGEMQAQIERHLRTASRQVVPDATQELHEALAALRQSLR